MEQTLDQQLKSLIDEQKTFVGKANEEIANYGKAAKATEEKLEALQKQLDAIDKKMQKPGDGAAAKPFSEELKENESVQRLMKDGRGTAVIHVKGGIKALERKTTISNSAVGLSTSGVLMIERDPGVEMQPMKRLFVRNLLPSRPTSLAAIDYVKINAFTSAASPQVEASDKGESAITFTTATANVRTLAHWVPASKQVLSDFAELMSVIETELTYGYQDKEEQELLSGDNTGEHLNGLITQATGFNTALLVPASSGWNKADVLGRAIQQIEMANQTTVDWIVLNPQDFWDIVLTKDANHNYVAGNAYNVLQPRIWGRPVAVTNNITAGTFLVGNSTKAIIRDREELAIEISTEHSDFFVKNKVAIRAEGRLALVVRRPASFITGSLTTSPA